MASDAKSTVAEAVRQGCRQLDGYLEEIVAQAASTATRPWRTWSPESRPG